MLYEANDDGKKKIAISKFGFEIQGEVTTSTKCTRK